MNETWYLLKDGTAASPLDIEQDADGVLRHKDGRLVKMRTAEVPATTGNPVRYNAEVETMQVKPEKQVKPGYKTRESKAG